MISKKDILKMVHSVTRHSRGKQPRKLMNPQRDWLIGIMLFLIIALVGGVINARSYVYFNTIESRVSEDPVPVKEYRDSDADVAIERYQARADRFATLANEAAITPASEQGTSTATSSDGVGVADSSDEAEQDIGTTTGESEQTQDASATSTQ